MTPDAWVKYLSGKLDERARQVEKNQAWYDGNHPIPAPPQNTFARYDREARIAFEQMAKLGITNMLAPVVDQPAAKLRLEKFKYADQPTSADKAPNAIWTRNHLDADQDLSTTAALITGQAFLLVWPGPDGAEITVEDPSQAIVAYVAGSRRKRAAGLKRWLDDSGYMLATLYLPDGIYKYKSSRRVDSQIELCNERGQVVEMADWQPRFVDNEPWPVPNPYNVVTLVEQRANPPLKPSMVGGGVSEFANVITDQRRVNQTIMNMLVTQDHQSFRQRWVTGWGAPTNEDGTPDKQSLMKASAAALWTFEGDDVKVGDFSQADFRPFIDAVNLNARLIASNSSTPPRAFLLSDLINVAAEVVASIESTFTAKCQKHQRQFGEGYIEAVNLALMMDEEPVDPLLQIVWDDVEPRTATEQANVAKIMDDLGAPKAAVFAALPDVTHEEAERWVAEQDARALLFPELNTPSPVPAPAA